ncbi:VOC family protein [Pseudomonas sp. MMS21-TM103]|uniref:VOC family protein n=1 Tax=Pseudomonas sp. MMS21 TM103 TaxID=2886506 RepID=UPI001EDCD713|nr:VOC family protein [Pseudomonas sp. MMS21 TM103]MCG4454913.1 VOC family protein [Pseudomonas sp. MMS21 TM103]
MNIIGPDTLIFGVDDVEQCEKFFTDYGLNPVGEGRFEALDGTGVVVKHRDDSSLPAWTLETANMLRKTVYGVKDQSVLDEIKCEFEGEREIKVLLDGSLEVVDDVGFTLGFQITVRKDINLSAERVNAPGSIHRPANTTGVIADNSLPPPKPRSLSHVVYFVPDIEKAENFYTNRLGFRLSDRFVGMGPFLRPAGTFDHHTLFFIQTPPELQGCEHFTFHMGGPSEVFSAGYAFAGKGYESYWGPGRHQFGSNWFWYFNTPLGCHIEYDADMDQHDDDWVPRVAPAIVDNSQIFLFNWREKWAPGGPK